MGRSPSRNGISMGQNGDTMTAVRGRIYGDAIQVMLHL
jgi:hypothetical protein